MRLTKWVMSSALLVSFFGFAGSQVRAGQQDSRTSPHVYSNDDSLFDHPPADTPAAVPRKSEEATPPKPSERPDERLAPFVATPMEVVDKMLDVAKVTAGDVVYDLGSGDGRIVIQAAQKYSAKGVGVELDRLLAEESLDKVRELKLEDKVQIIRGDLLKTDIKGATVVAVYLLLGANEKLRPKLEKELKAGTRVVAHDMRVPGWKPDQEESLTLNGVIHYIYLYEVPRAFQNK